MQTRLSLSKKALVDSLKGGSVPPLYAEIPYSSPYEIYPAFSGPESFLLESVKGPPGIARYSFIGFDPYMTYWVKDGLVKNGIIGPGRRIKNPLRGIGGLLAQYRQRPDPALPPFQGGAVGLLSYDFVHYFERLPARAKDDLQLPDAHFLLIDKLIAFDHLRKKAWIIVCPGIVRPGWAGAPEAALAEAFEEAEEKIFKIKEAALLPPPKKSADKGHSAGRMEITHEMTEARYEAIVMRAKEYIASGDIFQANLSLRVSAAIGGLNPWALYGVLREINPAPFACFMDFGDYFIASSSPERLLRVRDGIVETRPIAGTRPRGRDEVEDRVLRSELLLSDKERAEHIMLIDLERNDIGKVCDYGSVDVDELMITEDYSHVMHIVSNVRGRLNAGRSPLDAVRAVFPGGTITGVPKVRCMEIIDELESVRRGPYTGSAGYIGFSGNVDLNILIRTFTIKSGVAYVQAGSGIVADSQPRREYRESLKKAEALISTLKRLNGSK